MKLKDLSLTETYYVNAHGMCSDCMIVSTKRWVRERYGRSPRIFDAATHHGREQGKILVISLSNFGDHDRTALREGMEEEARRIEAALVNASPLPTPTYGYRIELVTTRAIESTMDDYNAARARQRQADEASRHRDDERQQVERAAEARVCTVLGVKYGETSIPRTWREFEALLDRYANAQRRVEREA